MHERGKVITRSSAPVPGSGCHQHRAGHVGAAGDRHRATGQRTRIAGDVDDRNITTVGLPADVGRAGAEAEIVGIDHFFMVTHATLRRMKGTTIHVHWESPDEVTWQSSASHTETLDVTLKLT